MTRTLLIPILAPLLTIGLAGCGAGSEATNNAAAISAASAGFRPPAEQAPTPIPGVAQITPLSAYVGKHPADVVDGVGFYDRTEVATALRNAVGDERVRRRFTTRGATEAPIFASKGRIAAHACEAKDCGGHNWTLYVGTGSDGGNQPAEACYHDAAMGATSRWYAGAAPTTRPGDCPAA